MLIEPPRTPGRPPMKHGEIVDALRRRIVSGRLRPGDKVPIRKDIEQQFDASRATVQRAMDELIRNGFIVAKGRRGTFVSEMPPHLFNYGLLFPQDPRDPALRQTPWSGSHFLIALGEQAVTMQSDPTRMVSIYCNITPECEGPDYERLIEDIRSQRLAGLIASNPYDLHGTPLLTPEVAGAIPLVGLGFEGSLLDLGTTLGMPPMSMLNKAMGWIKQQGRSRTSIICGASMDRKFMEDTQRLAHQNGLEIQTRWFQGISPANAAWAANSTEMVFSLPEKDRPDALLISDDTLAEHALAGLSRTGVQPGRDISVISHCNFPWPQFAIGPVQRIGVDVHQLLEHCIDLIDKRRRGEAVPDNLTIEPVFEEELASSTVRG